MFKNVCDADGCIWLEVDLSCPVCADCDSTSLDGYTGTTIEQAASGTSFAAAFRRYEELEFEDKIGEVSFDENLAGHAIKSVSAFFSAGK